MKSFKQDIVVLCFCDFVLFCFFILFCFYFICIFVLNLYADINECQGSGENIDCGPHARCVNTQGSYYCRCLPGYHDSGNGCVGMYKAAFIVLTQSILEGMLLVDLG